MTNERDLERIRLDHHEPQEDDRAPFEPSGYVECLQCRVPLYVGEEAYTVAGEWYCSVGCAEAKEWNENELALTEVTPEDARTWLYG